MSLGGICTQVINASLQHFILAVIPWKRIPHSVRTPDTDQWPFYLLTVIIRKPHHLPTAGSFFYFFFWIGTRMAPSLVSDSTASLGEQVWILVDGNNYTPYGALVSSRSDVREVTCRHFVGEERCCDAIWTPVPSSPLQSPSIRSLESPEPLPSPIAARQPLTTWLEASFRGLIQKASIWEFHETRSLGERKAETLVSWTNWGI